MEALIVIVVIAACVAFLVYRAKVTDKVAKVLDLVRGKRPKDIPSDTDRV